MKMPKKPTQGPPAMLEWARGIHDMVQSLQPVKGVGINVKQTTNGTSYSLSSGAGSGSGSTKDPVLRWQ